MSTRPKFQQVGDQEAREKVAERVGRPVNAIGLVRPKGNSTAVRWLGGICWFIPGDLLSNAAVEVATIETFQRRNARAAGLPAKMLLAVTEHDFHLFKARPWGHAAGAHVTTVPYGMVSVVRVSGRTDSAKLTIELVDGAEIRLEGEPGQGRKTRKVFAYLRDCAAAVPVGTVPPTAVRPEANAAGVLETVAGLVAKGAGAVGEQVKANRSRSH